MGNQIKLWNVIEGWEYLYKNGRKKRGDVEGALLTKAPETIEEIHNTTDTEDLNLRIWRGLKNESQPDVWFSYCYDDLRLLLHGPGYRAGDVSEITVYKHPSRKQLATIKGKRGRSMQLYVWKDFPHDQNQGVGQRTPRIRHQHWISMAAPRLSAEDGPRHMDYYSGMQGEQQFFNYYAPPLWTAEDMIKLNNGPVQEFFTGRLQEGECESFFLEVYSS